MLWYTLHLHFPALIPSPNNPQSIGTASVGNANRQGGVLGVSKPSPQNRNAAIKCGVPLTTHVSATFLFFLYFGWGGIFFGKIFFGKSYLHSV